MDYILYEKQDRTAIITLNRPDKRNALHPGLVAELKEVIEQAGRDVQVKVLLIKANGPAFCSGADLEYLKQLQTNTYEENLADSRRLKDFFHRLYAFPKPTVAQVTGHAIAGGAGFVSVCDFSFVVPEAMIGYTEVRIGFIPAIVSPFLIRKIGQGRSREMLLSGKLYTASEAREMGLVSQVVASTEITSFSSQFCDDLIKSNSPNSMTLTKAMIRELTDKNLEADLEYLAEMNARARSTDDCKQGISAFLEKKPLEW